MRKLFCLIFLLFPLAVIAQEADSAWMVNHYVKREQYIRMRDGIKLFTAIYMPKDSTLPTHPILMTRTTYSCAPYGKDWIGFWGEYLKKYFAKGYIFVIQDVRGRWMSEGQFENVRPFNPDKKTNKDIDEASDSYDTIDWLVKNIPGNNGKVGVLGVSYPGFYAAMAALSGHPALKAVSPEAPVTDWFLGDDFHHNGALMLQDAYNFFIAWGFSMPHPKPTMADDPYFYQSIDDSYAYFLKKGALPYLNNIAATRQLKFWADMVQHPNYDAWWKARDHRNYVNKIPAGVASLVVGGLFDAEDGWGAVHLYKAIAQTGKNNNKFVFGPWYHGEWSGDVGDHLGNIQFGSHTGEWYVDNIELPFFEYYLRGIGTDSIAKATVFFTGENKWHKLPQWPPAGVQPTSLFLQKNGKLSFEKPTANNSYAEYTSDPAKPVPYNDGTSHDRSREYMDDDQRFAATRPDVLVFESDTLTSDFTLAGPLTADLKVSISTTDADFVVKLIDVFPDNFSYTADDEYPMGGYEMMIRGDVFRGRYRNSFAKPEAFVPGKITSVKYTMNDVAHTFKKGHRIMVQVKAPGSPLSTVTRNNS